MTTAEIKKIVLKIGDSEMLSVQEIHEMGVIVDTKLEPSRFSLYRIIKRGELKAVNLGGSGAPRYFVEGKDLKRFLCERYSIIIPKK